MYNLYDNNKCYVTKNTDFNNFDYKTNNTLHILNANYIS